MEIALGIIQSELITRHELVEPPVDLGDIDSEPPIAAILVNSRQELVRIDSLDISPKRVCTLRAVR